MRKYDEILCLLFDVLWMSENEDMLIYYLTLLVAYKNDDMWKGGSGGNLI